MRLLILLLLFSPLFSHSQSGRISDAANSIRIKSYTTSAGTFTIEHSDASQRMTLPDKIYFKEDISITSDGSTATYIFNEEEVEFEDEQSISIPGIEVNIFPNPFTQTTHGVINNASIDFLDTRLIIYDLFGRGIKRQGLYDFYFTIERENLPEGMYFYQITDADSSVMAKGKFIIANQ